MKRFFPLLLCVLALVSLACPALASDAPPGEAEWPEQPVTVETSAGDKDITVNVTVVNEAASPASDTPSDEPPAASAPVESLPVEAPSNDGVILKALDDSAPSDRSPLMEAVYGLFGEYRPRTCTVSTYLPDGSVAQSVEPVPGLAGLDYIWLASFGLFALALYCVFRMIGGLLKWS